MCDYINSLLSGHPQSFLLSGYIKMYSSIGGQLTKSYEAQQSHIKYVLHHVSGEYEWPACPGGKSITEQGGWNQKSLACENECEPLIPRVTDVADWLE